MESFSSLLYQHLNLQQNNVNCMANIYARQDIGYKLQFEFSIEMHEAKWKTIKSEWWLSSVIHNNWEEVSNQNV